MPGKAEIDAAFLAQHQALTERFYAAKRAGPITPALQTLFEKVHAYLVALHFQARIANGFDPDYLWDEERDDAGNIITPGTKLFSVVLREDLAGRLKLSNAEKTKIESSWGVVI